MARRGQVSPPATRHPRPGCRSRKDRRLEAPHKKPSPHSHPQRSPDGPPAGTFPRTCHKCDVRGVQCAQRAWCSHRLEIHLCTHCLASGPSSLMQAAPSASCCCRAKPDLKLRLGPRTPAITNAVFDCTSARSTIDVTWAAITGEPTALLTRPIREDCREALDCDVGGKVGRCYGN